MAALCARYFEEGDRIVTAWTPCTQKNASAWKEIMNIWRTVDGTLAIAGGKNQIVVTSRFLVRKKVFTEIGAPESTTQFF